MSAEMTRDGAGEDPTPRLVPLAPVTLGATLACLALGRLAADDAAATTSAIGTPVAQSVLPVVVLSVASGSAGLLLMVLGLLWRRQPLGPVAAHAVLAGCVLLGSADTVAYTQATGRADRSAELILLAAASALCLVRRLWFVGALGGVLLGWLVLAAPGGPATGLYVVGLVVSATVALTTRRARLARLDEVAGLRHRAGLSVLDPLTGLPDRQGIALIGAQLLAIARRESGAIGCTVVQLVGLDGVRVRAGQVAADALVSHVAEVLRGAVRGTDVVGRWSNDQLVVVAHGPGASLDILIGRLGDALEPGCPLSARQWPRRLRMGHALLEPWDDGGLLTTIASARRSMERSLPFDPATHPKRSQPQQREQSAQAVHQRDPHPGGDDARLEQGSQQVAGS